MIVLAVGSGCTIAGLVAGMAVILSLPEESRGFKKPLESFEIRGVIIHQFMAKIPFFVRKKAYVDRPSFVHVTIGYSSHCFDFIIAVCWCLDL